MSRPDLILLEGMPGAGKSTAAQLITLAMRHSGRPARWSYEEVVDHPLFGFHDFSAVDRFVGPLREGRFEGVVGEAVGRWRTLTRRLPASGTTTVADGCLLGYLTWSLYRADAPPAVITGYFEEVAAVLASIDTVVVHLRPEDVAHSWRNLAESRGGEWTRSAVEGVERSPAGGRMGLRGFQGLVRYWTGFLELADDLSGRLRSRRHIVPVAVGGESEAQARVIELLGLRPPRLRLDRPAEDHAGTYVAEDGVRVEVGVEGDVVTVAGVPGAWPRVALVPLAPDVFQLRSMPWDVRFTFDGGGHATALDISGPPLLDAVPPGGLVRIP